MKFLLALLMICSTTFAQTAPGLVVTFSAKGKTDATTSPRPALYVHKGESPTPFFDPGPFKATWTGFLNVELRSDYTFSAEHTGSVKLTINGVVQEGKPTRLQKGTNSIVVEYESPASGDAHLRLFWKPRKGLKRPVPANAFTHIETPDEHRGKTLRLGRELFIDHRCANCHEGLQDLDAPNFAGIGSRLNQSWMAEWIANPQRMPNLVSPAQATDIAAYLAALTDKESPPARATGDGKAIYEKLQCGACHTELPKGGPKFAPGHLAEYLLNPSAHFPASRMPRFKLSLEDASALATFLGDGNAAPPQSGDPNRGKEIIQSRGCLNCHASSLENKFQNVAIADFNKGCMTDAKFTFNETELAALRAFLQTDRKIRFAAAESAEHLSRSLNCRACHDKIEGLPKFDLLGEKLRPDWSHAFIEGKIDYKPRPWLDAQMPAFSKWSKILAEGMAAQHGIGPTPTDQTETALAEEGRKLISAQGGFSCVTCHPIGDRATSQVAEAAGINFWWSAERLFPDYFDRWLANPLAIDPTTKMPVYFDEEGRSPLADVLDGDGAKQRDAIWQYLRQGKTMNPPD